MVWRASSWTAVQREPGGNPRQTQGGLDMENQPWVATNVLLSTFAQLWNPSHYTWYWTRLWRDLKEVGWFFTDFGLLLQKNCCCSKIGKTRRISCNTITWGHLRSTFSFTRQVPTATFAHLPSGWSRSVLPAGCSMCVTGVCDSVMGSACPRCAPAHTPLSQCGDGACTG